MVDLTRYRKQAVEVYYTTYWMLVDAWSEEGRA